MRIKIFICCILFITVPACDKKSVFDKYTSVNSRWDIDRAVSYDFKIADTIQRFNLFIKLRTSNNYKFSNLFLIVDLKYPNGKVMKDTLEYKMANADGSMLGDGNIFIKEHKLWFKGHQDAFRFSETGAYSIAIKHAVRELGNPQGVKFLEGIEDVGFRIELLE
ncbi:MAG: gliding motility lipoprotein GldH [Bacteroidota bacterium]|nr:gliding motility lipoprotein GldH [Bacteroidota bacterium]